MADVSYVVEVLYKSSGDLSKNLGLSGAGEKIGNLKRQIGDAARTIETAGQSFGSGLSSALAAFGAFEGVASIIRSSFDFIKLGLLEMNADIERMSIGMAGVFAARGTTSDFAGGLELGSQLVTQMRADAEKLPGTFKQLMTVFQGMQNPGIDAGMRAGEIESMAKRAMAFGVTGGMNPATIGHEMGMLLSGQVRANMPLLRVLPGLNMHGDELKKFRAMSAEDRALRVRKALGMEGGQEARAYSAMQSATANSWLGLTTTLKQRFQTMAMDLTAPLFDHLKNFFRFSIGWLNTHAPQINDLMERLGRTLANTFDMGVHFAGVLGEKLHTVMAFIESRAKGHHLVADVGRVGGVMVAGKIAAGLAGPLSSVGGSIAKMGMKALAGGGGEGVLGTLTGAGALGGGAAAAGGGALAFSLETFGIGAAVLATVLAACAVAATAVYGVFEGITNELSPFHDMMVSTWNDIRATMGDTLAQLKKSFDDIYPAFRTIADIFGQTTLNIIKGCAVALDAFVGALDTFLHTGPMQFFLKTLAIPDRKKRADEKDQTEHFSSRFGNPENTTKTPPPPNHITHIHNVEIKVVSNEDPSRIAVKTRDVFRDWMRHPTFTPNMQSPFTR